MPLNTRRTVGTASIGAGVGAAAWVVIGLINLAFATRSSRWIGAVSLVFPPTVPTSTWHGIAPWNVLVTMLGALVFAGLLGLAFAVLLSRFGRSRASTGSVFLSAWLLTAIAALVVAAVWSVGATFAITGPTGLEWAFRQTQPELLQSALFGVVWGWVPALTVVALARRGADAATGARGTRSRWWWLFALVAVLTIVAGIGVVFAQPAVSRAERIAAGGTPDGRPTPTSTSTPAPTPTAPARTAPGAAAPGADWCKPEETSLTVSATQAALGHRGITLVLINRSLAPCIVDGYPDLAFANADGDQLGVTIEHGTSYVASDPGARAVTLAAGASAESTLGWGATGARDGAATTLWAAQYPGAERVQLPIDSDITDDSIVTVTAWGSPHAAG